MPTYYLGLDVHKVRTQHCLMDPAGQILGEGNVSTEEAAGLVRDPTAPWSSRPPAAGTTPTTRSARAPPLFTLVDSIQAKEGA